jgi:hypothetical protein
MLLPYFHSLALLYLLGTAAPVTATVAVAITSTNFLTSPFL